MHEPALTRDQAFELLKKYNKDPFHIRHALTMEGVMAWYAQDSGCSEETAYWSQCGLLHDIDFENWPDQHCKKAPELLREGGCSQDMIDTICSHGYGICSDVEPRELMDRILFAADELTGLIWSASLMRPSRSVRDMEVKSVMKKFKDRKFAEGCSRDVIITGAERLGWDLNTLIQKTIDAMKSCEKAVNDYMESYS